MENVVSVVTSDGIDRGVAFQPPLGLLEDGACDLASILAFGRLRLDPSRRAPPPRDLFNPRVNNVCWTALELARRAASRPLR